MSYGDDPEDVEREIASAMKMMRKLFEQMDTRIQELKEEVETLQEKIAELQNGSDK